MYTPCSLSGVMKNIYKTADEATRNYAQFAYNVPKLTREETNRLIKKYQEEGDQEAKKLLVESNIQFVLNYVANVYQIGKYVQTSNLLDDLIQDGTVGMITALDTFDPSKGFAFQTHAGKWIKKEVSLSFEKNASGVTKSIYYKRMTKLIEGVEQNYRMRLNRDPSPEEIMGELNMSETVYNNVVSCPGESGMCELTPAVLDIIESDVVTEDAAINRVETALMLDRLAMILMPEEYELMEYMLGSEDAAMHTNITEVARHFNISKQAISKKLTKIKEKIIVEGIFEEAYNELELKMCNKARKFMEADYKKLFNDIEAAYSVIKQERIKEVEALREAEALEKSALNTSDLENVEFELANKDLDIPEMEEDKEMESSQFGKGFSIEEFAKDFFAKKNKNKGDL